MATPIQTTKILQPTLSPIGVAPMLGPVKPATAPVLGPVKPATTTVVTPTVAKPSIGAQLDAAQAEALRIKAQVEKLSQQQSPTISTNKLVSDSSSVVSNENNIKNEINKLSVPNPSEEAAKLASEEHMKVLDDQLKKLEQQRATELSQLDQNFTSAENSLKEGQTKETGMTTTTLARIGGFLGASASSIGALNNLAASHRAEITALAAKRAEAIHAANTAANAREFAVAQAKAKEAKDLENEINDRRQKFFDNTSAVFKLKQEAENRARDDSRASLNTILTNFGGVDFEELDKESQSAIEAMSITAGFPVDLIKGQMKTLKEMNLQLSQQKREDAQTQRDFQNQIAVANLGIRDMLANLSLKRFEESENITALNAGRLGLPLSLVGLDENQIYEQLRSENIPQWFSDLKLKNSTSTPVEKSKIWDDFRGRVIKTGSGGGQVDYGSLNLPPPIK